jgi:hypothetical protein
MRTDDTRSFGFELIEPDALVPEPDVPEAVVPDPVVPDPVADPVVPVLVLPLVPDVLLEESIVPVTSTLWPTCAFSSASCPSSTYVECVPEALLLEPVVLVLVPDVPVLPDPEPIIALVSM